MMKLVNYELVESLVVNICLTGSQTWDRRITLRSDQAGSLSWHFLSAGSTRQRTRELIGVSCASASRFRRRLSERQCVCHRSDGVVRKICGMIQSVCWHGKTPRLAGC
jgi:hypothetical protein